MSQNVGTMSEGELVSPLQWRDWVAADHTRDSGPRFLDGGIVQAWAGSQAKMYQPPLDHHLIVLHQGGPKLVHRSHGRFSRSANVALNSCTTVEAGSAYDWRTEGPISFLHVYVRPERFADVVGSAYGRDPANVGFAERMGHVDPLIAQLAMVLAHDATDDPAMQMAASHYFDSLLIRIATTTTYGQPIAPERLALTPATVRRVRDYIMAHLADPITLDDLAAVAGYSRFYFVRAFRECTGYPPYNYVINQRIAHAKFLLTTTNDPVSTIAQSCGFATHAQFSKKFRDLTGQTPAAFRRY